MEEDNLKSSSKTLNKKEINSALKGAAVSKNPPFEATRSTVISGDTTSNSSSSSGGSVGGSSGSSSGVGDSGGGGSNNEQYVTVRASRRGESGDIESIGPEVQLPRYVFEHSEDSPPTIRWRLAILFDILTSTHCHTNFKLFSILMLLLLPLYN